MKQVVSISPTGEVSGLQHSKGKGFDLLALSAIQGGEADVTRASEIYWLPKSQRWVVMFKDGAGKYSGSFLSPLLTQQIIKCVLNISFCVATHLGIRTDYDIVQVAIESQEDMFPAFAWKTYEEAIEAEIRVMNAFRIAGHL